MKQYSPREMYSVLAWCGVVALVLVIILPRLAVMYHLRGLNEMAAQIQQDSASTTTTPGLGEEGAQCGGTERLPCKAGLMCLTSAGAAPEVTGTCVPAGGADFVTTTTPVAPSEKVR